MHPNETMKETAKVPEAETACGAWGFGFRGSGNGKGPGGGARVSADSCGMNRLEVEPKLPASVARSARLGRGVIGSRG